ncbi:MAG: hypothetical protein AVDCRST_MAG32-1443, partial [uncultured Nocardioides sp.]
GPAHRDTPRGRLHGRHAPRGDRPEHGRDVPGGAQRADHPGARPPAGRLRRDHLPRLPGRGRPHRGAAQGPGVQRVRGHRLQPAAAAEALPGDPAGPHLLHHPDRPGAPPAARPVLGAVV